MDANTLLSDIATLSHEFGGDAYVRGGGGNTSCKTPDHLYIKPSGTTLADIAPDQFLGLDRGKLDKLFTAEFPKTVADRERGVIEFMAATVLPGLAGRPSVEAPLHHSFPQTFVVHTHPALVNAMTCGQDGQAACARLFPDALWMPVIEPGYTLGMRVREELAGYKQKHGKAAAVLFLASHGVFIAGDTPDDIRALYTRVIDTLTREVKNAGIDPAVAPVPTLDPATAAPVAQRLKALIGDNAACIAPIARIPLYAGALTPDHIVYCGGVMYDGDGSDAQLTAYHDRYNLWPKVVGMPDMVLGLGAAQRSAELAAELAWDAANVVRLAGAFGGVKFLDQYFLDFIQNWEVESYRRKVAAK